MSLVQRAMRIGCAVLVGASAVLASAPAASAARLFTTAAAVSRPGDPTAIAGARALTLNRGVLADVRAGAITRLDAFPLGTAGSATIDLVPIAPFPVEARAEIVGGEGSYTVPLPDARYFTGRVGGDPAGLVVLIAAPTHVRGFVATHGDVFPFGPDVAGTHRSYALSAADPARYPRPTAFCAGEQAAGPAPATVPAAQAVPAPAATDVVRVAEVAIETDNELRGKFPSDAAALDYLTSLLAAAAVIYERDVQVRLAFPYVRLWAPGVTDPWTRSGTSDSLAEVRDYWNLAQNGMRAAAGNPDLVHFVSGKPVAGGVAYVNVLCNPTYGYGVSQVYGAFDLSDPTGIWDVEVFSHEMGHNFGSRHTHCYDPPLDHCWAAEAGCYAGPVERSQGTIMSYCHQRTGGLANISLEFGATVSARIGQSVAVASCLATEPATTTTSTTGVPGTTTSTTVATTSTTTSAPPSSSTVVPATTTSSTTTPAATTSTSSTVAPSSTTSTASTTTTASTATSTTQAPPADGDADRDGVRDGIDGCPGTPSGDLVDGGGCSVCPCPGPREGGAWRSRSAYVRCMRGELRRRAALHDGTDTAGALRRAQRATCGRRNATRCCPPGGRCRVVRAATCAPALDAGQGPCDDTVCLGR